MSAKAEWQYTWMREVLQSGVSIETAWRGFRERVGYIDDVDLMKNPSEDAKVFVSDYVEKDI